MNNRPNPTDSSSHLIDELLAQQDKVIGELEDLDQRLLKTIEEFRASIKTEEDPAANSESQTQQADQTQTDPTSGDSRQTQRKAA